MKRITTKDIAICGFMTSIMFILGIITVSVTNGGKSIFQISDAIFLALLTVLNPLSAIVSAISSSVLTDLYAGGMVFIPITILVKTLIGLTYLGLKKFIPVYLNIAISYLWLFIYVLYVYLLFDASLGFIELITDSIQYGITIFFGSVFIYFLNKTQFKQKVVEKDGDYNSSE